MKEDILRLLSEGFPYNRIVAQLGCSKATVAYHAKKIGVAPGRKVHSWPDIQAYYDAGHTLRECRRQFGFSLDSWYKACEAGYITPRERRIPLETLMVEGRKTGRSHLKWRLIEAGLLKPECYECGLNEWRGQPIALELHHGNGNRYDNRQENLQLLCPNCHSQTSTYSGRNSMRIKIK